MNPTPNQITECDDEKQLCDLSGIHCMGADKIEAVDVDMESAPSVRVYNLWKGDQVLVLDWQPTSPTEKGKAQATDLAVKYDLVVHASIGVAIYGNVYQKSIKEDSWQIAVVKAALLCVIGGEL